MYYQKTKFLCESFYTNYSPLIFFFFNDLISLTPGQKGLHITRENTSYPFQNSKYRQNAREVSRYFWAKNKTKLQLKLQQKFNLFIYFKAGA